MLNALDLSECLTSSEFNDIQSALAAYEKQMLARAVIPGKEAVEGIVGFASPSESSVKELIQLFNQIE